MTSDDEELMFQDEVEELANEIPSHSSLAWTILVVDDQEEVHQITKYALKNYTFDDKRITFIDAYSAQAAREILATCADIALILLDVVMEEHDSGLQLVSFIRDELQNRLVRIILRTGQPGYAPEKEIILRYDINDYRDKTELSNQKLFTTITTGLRSYKDLLLIEEKNTQLSKLVDAYGRFVPKELIHILNKESIIDVQLGDSVQQEMTVVFTDIRDFTQLSESLKPEEVFSFLNDYLGYMEPIISAQHGFIDKYIGDAIMALFPRSADDALQAAIQMLHRLCQYNHKRQLLNFPPLRIGNGINSGQLMLGTVGGEKRMDGTVVSDTVNLASRIENLCKLYNVSLLLSENTVALLSHREQYHMRTIDNLKVKGKSIPVTIYEVFDADPPELFKLKKITLSIFTTGLGLFKDKQFESAKKTFEQVIEINPTDKVAHLYIKRCEKILKYYEGSDWAYSGEL